MIATPDTCLVNAGSARLLANGMSLFACDKKLGLARQIGFGVQGHI